MEKRNGQNTKNISNEDQISLFMKELLLVKGKTYDDQQIWRAQENNNCNNFSDALQSKGRFG